MGLDLIAALPGVADDRHRVDISSVTSLAPVDPQRYGHLLHAVGVGEAMRRGW